MLVGYMRASKAVGSQTVELQRDALLAAGVNAAHLYDDHASGRRDDRPGLTACLKAPRDGDTLVVWKLDRLGRNLHHLVNAVHDLTARGVGLKVLTGQGAAIDTTTPAGKLSSGSSQRWPGSNANSSPSAPSGLKSARARGRKGGTPFKMTPAKLRPPHPWANPDTKIGELCTELGITSQTLYRHVSPTGELRADGLKLLADRTRKAPRAFT